MKELKATKVFRYCQRCKTRYLVHQGGTRSGKTYNILIWLVYTALNTKGKTFTIIRKTYPALKATVLRDFIEIMTDLFGMYDERFHNKTDQIYYMNGNVFEFVAIDQPQKFRGRKRDYCFINEANEVKYEDFMQLDFRTSEMMIFDFNPSESFWVHKHIIPMQDKGGNPLCTFHKTTYKDNKHLPQAQVEVIERLIESDEWYWKVYGLGELAPLRDAIFNNWDIVARVPADASLGGYGLDFGWHPDPAAVLEIYTMDQEIFVRELVYENGLTNPELARMLKEYEVRGRVICDSAEPKSIRELRNGGINAIGAEKGPDSVRASIDLLRQRKIHIIESSVNLIREMRTYKWRRDRAGELVGNGEPLKVNDHTIDALRYWAMDAYKNKSAGKYVYA